MEDNQNERLEALKTMYEYNQKLEPAIQKVMKELSEERKEDTDAYLEKILQGVNWVLQIVNLSMDTLNAKEVKIVKEEMNEYVMQINSAFLSKDDLKMMEALEQGILPFLHTLDGIVVNLAGINLGN